MSFTQIQTTPCHVIVIYLHEQYYILEESNFNFRYVRPDNLNIPKEKWLNYLQTMETDQMPHSVASDLDLHCLPIYPFGDF